MVGFLAALITMSGFGDHLAGLSDHVDRNAQFTAVGVCVALMLVWMVLICVVIVFGGMTQRAPARAVRAAAVVVQPVAPVRLPAFVLPSVQADRPEAVKAADAVEVLKADRSPADMTGRPFFRDAQQTVVIIGSGPTAGPWVFPEPAPMLRLDGTPLTQPPTHYGVRRNRRY